MKIKSKPKHSRKQLWSRTISVLVGLIYLASGVGDVSAISEKQKNLYAQGIGFYDIDQSILCDTDEGVVGSSEGGPLTGVKFPAVADKGVLAQAIKDYIQKGWPKSPLIPYADDFVKYGEKYDVNPLIPVIIAQVEYQFGTIERYVGPGAPGQYNFWAVTHGNTPGVRFGAYESIDQAMEEHFKLLAGVGANVPGITYIGPPQNMKTIGQIMRTYAPSFENDTPTYINTIIKGMKKILADGGVTSTEGETVAADTEDVPADAPAGCTDGEALTPGDFTETVKAYAHPDYHPPQFVERMPAYAAAVTKAAKDGRYIGGSVAGVQGIDCGAFVTILMVDSGFEPEYNSKGKGGNTGPQQDWLRANWEQIRPTSTRDLKAGDVAINSEHTYVYVGSIDGFNSQIASASYSERGNGRAPMAGHETPASGDFNWYRKR